LPIDENYFMAVERNNSGPKYSAIKNTSVINILYYEMEDIVNFFFYFRIPEVIDVIFQGIYRDLKIQ